MNHIVVLLCVYHVGDPQGSLGSLLWVQMGQGGGPGKSWGGPRGVAGVLGGPWLDWTKQRVSANENCAKPIGMEFLCTLIRNKWPRPLAEIVSCPMHETT